MGKKRKPVAFQLSKPALSRARSTVRTKPASAGEISMTLKAQAREKSLPPIFVGRDGNVMRDPWAALGIGPGDPRDAEAVEVAFRKALAVTTPERDPEGARALMEARRFLLSPENVLLREIGDLRVPNPETFFHRFKLSEVTRDYLAKEAIGPEATATPARPEVNWTSQARLKTLMTLMALVEAEIEGDLPKPKAKTELF